MKAILVANFTMLLLLSLSWDSNAQCGTSDFVTADTAPFCAPGTATFKALNNPPNSKFEWDIGKGYSSGDSVSSYLFEKAGVFTVKCRITYPDLTVCILEKKNYIKVRNAEKPELRLSDTLFCDREDTAVYLYDITPHLKNRNYLFEGNLYKDASNPFAIDLRNAKFNGVYSIFMEIEDSFGCKSKLNFDTIFRIYNNESLKIKLSRNKGCIPFDLNAELSMDTFQSIEKVTWDVGTGVVDSANSLKTKITFKDTGYYDFITKVETKEGCAYRDTFFDAAIVGVKQKLQLTTSDQKLCDGGNVIHQLTNVHTRFNWTVSGGEYEVNDSSENWMDISFKEVGLYDLRVTSWHNGCKTDSVFNDYVEVEGPVAKLGTSHSANCFAPDTFGIYDLSSYPKTGSNKKKWNIYGDSGLEFFTSNKDTFFYIINNFERKSIELTVENTNGCKDTIMIPDAIVVENMEADIDLPTKKFCPSDTIDFLSNTKEASPDVWNKYKWEFIDTNGIDVIKNMLAKDTFFQFPYEGDFGVRFIAYNDLGCIDTITFLDTVHVNSPLIKIKQSDTNICIRDNVTLEAEIPDGFGGYEFE